LKITFVLPSTATYPIGGFKVVYGFCSSLVQIGHEVSVVHPANVGPLRPFQLAKKTFSFLARTIGLKETWKPSKWHALDARVHLLWRPYIANQFIPDADAIVATAWQTAEQVAALTSKKGAKFYLIQNLETQFDDANPTRAENTWKLPLLKMTTGKWLVEVGAKIGEEVEYVSQGFDYNPVEFDIDCLIENRQNPSVAMLFHEATWKGSWDGIHALEAVKVSLPKLNATLFGVSERPTNLPDWISYIRNPPRKVLRRLYNSIAVFVSPSWVEGCALPPGEAAQCGAALCLTDIGGHKDYAQNGVTALLSEAHDFEALANNITRLLTDSALRSKLAYAAKEKINTFRWHDSAVRMEAFLSQHAKISSNSC
jgi:glycosyltransferase involved in cell wall biosynthesis